MKLERIPRDDPVVTAVPFVVDRADAPRYRVFNSSDSTLSSVAARITGAGVLSVKPVRALHPGESLDLIVLGSELERDTRIVMSWFDDERRQYLWGFTF